MLFQHYINEVTYTGIYCYVIACVNAESNEWFRTGVIRRVIKVLNIGISRGAVEMAPKRSMKHVSKLLEK